MAEKPEKFLGDLARMSPAPSVAPTPATEKAVLSNDTRVRAVADVLAAYVIASKEPPKPEKLAGWAKEIDGVITSTFK
jgi:hypothetical protein